MIENNKSLQEISDDKLSEVAGGRTVDKYNFYDIESKSKKAYIEIEDGKVKNSWGLDKLNERDIAQLSDDIKKQVGLI